MQAVAESQDVQFLTPKTLEIRHLDETGDYPRSVGLSVWGTSAMRTSGDDIAEVLAGGILERALGEGERADLLNESLLREAIARQARSPPGYARTARTAVRRKRNRRRYHLRL